MAAIKELQKRFGASDENKRAERTSINEIRRLVVTGSGLPSAEGSPCGSRTSNLAEIRDILEHILFKPVSGLGLPFLSLNVDTGFIAPDEKDAALADVLVLEDWFYMNCAGEHYEFGNLIKNREFRYTIPLWKFFRNMGDKDPYYKRFMRIRVTDLMNFLKHKDGFRDIPEIVWGDGDPVNVRTITIGFMLEHTGNLFAGWNPGEVSIENYQNYVHKGCRRVQSIIHAICTAYYDVDARIAFFRENINKNKLGELLAEERRIREELGGFRQAV